MTTASGACGSIERVRLWERPRGSVEGVSPRGYVLVFREPAGKLRIHDTQSGRVTELPGQLLGISSDERRVFVLQGALNVDTGLLMEVDVAAGTARRLLQTPVSSKANYPTLGVGLLRGTDGGYFVLHLESSSVWPFSQPAERLLFQVDSSARRVLYRDQDMLVVRDLPSGQHWRFGPAEAANLLRDGDGVVYVDTQGRAWGWTPAGGPVLLGRHTVTEQRSLLHAANRFERASTGELLFVGTDRVATLWNPRTNAVRTVGTDVVDGALARSGTRLGLVTQAPDGTWAVKVRRLPDDLEQRLWEGAHPPRLTMNDTGSRLVITTVSIPNEAFPENEYFFARLWDLDSGTQLPLGGGGGSTFRTPPGVSFRDGGRLLHISYWESYDAIYSAEDGSLLHKTSRTVVPSEEHNFYWGPGNEFYARYGAYMGPPDLGLFAWNPRTGTETQLGQGTEAVCFLGSRNVFQRGLMHEQSSGDAAELVLWNPETGALEALARGAVGPACAKSAPAVLFMENMGRPEWEYSASPLYDLVYLDVDQGCRQQLGARVDWFRPHLDHVIFQTPEAVWRIRYPKR